MQQSSTTASSFVSTLLGVSLVNALLDSLSTIQPALVSDKQMYTQVWDLLLTFFPQKHSSNEAKSASQGTPNGNIGHTLIPVSPEQKMPRDPASYLSLFSSSFEFCIGRNLTVKNTNLYFLPYPLSKKKKLYFCSFSLLHDLH